ncbi:DUF397 domain-containing protein [Streptomyces lavendofoliae]|uniref:DUF397 domain-containing protein n=1 Tax=Streptomyces lavendofoliae TaxID=67314 RepID=UPI00167704DC|nr:DUF397 domain-containing protein [Streptomyces lavendofoliae]
MTPGRTALSSCSRRRRDEAGSSTSRAGAALASRSPSTPHTVHVRDSEDVTRPALALSPSAWSAFLVEDHLRVLGGRAVQ